MDTWTWIRSSSFKSNQIWSFFINYVSNWIPEPESGSRQFESLLSNKIWPALNGCIYGVYNTVENNCNIISSICRVLALSSIANVYVVPFISGLWDWAYAFWELYTTPVGVDKVIRCGTADATFLAIYYTNRMILEGLFSWVTCHINLTDTLGLLFDISITRDLSSFEVRYPWDFVLRFSDSFRQNVLLPLIPGVGWQLFVRFCTDGSIVTFFPPYDGEVMLLPFHFL